MVYAPKISPEEARLDLHLSADFLQRKIKAFNPSPGAFIETSFGRLKLLSGQALNALQTDFPGYFIGLSATGG